MLGLGVWQVENARECVDAVRWALEEGYRHIDTAQAYGNEERVGLGLRHSRVQRDTRLVPPGRDRAGALQPSGSWPPPHQRYGRADRAAPRARSRPGAAALVHRAGHPDHPEVDAPRAHRRERPALRLPALEPRHRRARRARPHRRHRPRPRTQMVAKLTAQSSLRAAIDEAASRDPVLADLVARVGPIRHRPRDPDGPFGARARDRLPATRRPRRPGDLRPRARNGGGADTGGVHRALPPRPPPPRPPATHTRLPPPP